VVADQWVLLAYRIPREPSTPRIAVWRALRRLGAAQLLDGLVALPASAHTQEQLEWVAEEVVAAGGEADIWVARPGSKAQARALRARMVAAVTEEYAALARGAQAAADGRTRARLARELRRIRRRDWFGAPGYEQAAEALREPMEAHP
jgi:hypothetical protein